MKPVDVRNFVLVFAGGFLLALVLDVGFDLTMPWYWWIVFGIGIALVKAA